VWHFQGRVLDSAGKRHGFSRVGYSQARNFCTDATLILVLGCYHLYVVLVIYVKLLQLHRQKYILMEV